MKTNSSQKTKARRTFDETDSNDTFEAQSKESSVLDPAFVRVHAMGERTCGPIIFIDKYPLDSVAFVQCLEGELVVSLSDDKPFTLKAGHFVVLFPGRLLTVKATAKKNRFAYLSVVGPRAVDSSLRLGFWHLQTDRDEFPTEFFRDVCRRFDECNRAGDDRTVLLYVERMMRTMSIRRRQCGGNVPFYDAIRAANNLSYENFTTDAVARAMGISRSSLNNLFRAAGFMKPGEYLDRIRIARAKEVLYYSRKSNSEIARAMGFANENSFSLFFKRHVGVTPAKFRRQPILIAPVHDGESRK